MRALGAAFLLLAGAALATEPRVGAAGPRAGAARRKPLAGLVVRSKDWTVRRGADTVEEWTGDVSYRKEGREIHADWAERRHKTERWLARGHVRAVWRGEDGAVLEARGEEARHDGTLEKGELNPAPGGWVRIERRLPDVPEPDRARGRRLSWDSAARTARLEGDVHAWGPSGEAWAGRADYAHALRRLDLSGRRPVLVYGDPAQKWNGAVQAERIEATDRPTRVAADGRVRGWAVFENRPKTLRGL